MTLYRVSILDHPRVDWLVSICGNGAVWCLERIGIVQFYEKCRPVLEEAITNDKVTGRGFFLPVVSAEPLGKRFELAYPWLTLIWNAAHRGRGNAGLEAEKAFEWNVNHRFFEPTISRVLRKASEYEDKTQGVDFICETSIAASSGVQVKWDSKAELSGNLWIQIETEPVTSSWTKAPSGGARTGASP